MQQQLSLLPIEMNDCPDFEVFSPEIGSPTRNVLEKEAVATSNDEEMEYILPQMLGQNQPPNNLNASPAIHTDTNKADEDVNRKVIQVLANFTKSQQDVGHLNKSVTTLSSDISFLSGQFRQQEQNINKQQRVLDRLKVSHSDAIAEDVDDDVISDVNDEFSTTEKKKISKNLKTYLDVKLIFPGVCQNTSEGRGLGSNAFSGIALQLADNFGKGQMVLDKESVCQMFQLSWNRWLITLNADKIELLDIKTAIQKLNNKHIMVETETFWHKILYIKSRDPVKHAQMNIKQQTTVRKGKL
ncbi:unnamed protein product [Mytilus coruscus]|uniref:DUF4806 domain-containing protein n=1 Tax=Mytilus coruscus TaxID=42192 RepID=A0A6J8AIC7_MYTCO|nr:unnamed protein product [Mytilus coruscus]